jgi:heme exporter protein A
MSGPAAAVDVRDISKAFNRRTVLSGITFSLLPGDFLLILGPNGAGKTTLLRVLATLMAPTNGDASIAGFSLKEDPTEIRKRVGFISHSHLLYRDLTTYENLRFYGQMYGVPNLDARISELLDRVELSHRRFDVVRGFSRGMFQRLSIARALLHDPEVLFLDEPQTGLDPHAVDILEALIGELAGKRTFIMVTHNLDRGLTLGNRALILKQGRAVYLSEGRLEAAELKATYGRLCDMDVCDE